VAKLALLGGGVALLASEDLRNQLLDLLFGAEEEFDYGTLTEPPAPSAPPDVPSEPFVRSAPAEPAEPAESEPRTGPHGLEDDAPEAPATGEGEGEGEPAAADPSRDPDLSGDAPGEVARGGSSIAPSPAAWRAAAAAVEGERRPDAENGPQASASSASPPPAPPGWWKPTSSGPR
jgi:hypothetical protein